MNPPRERIWELDAFRGLCILGMVGVHLVYDLVELFGIVHWQYPAAFALLRDWGGVLFLLLSGICVTLGTHSVRRGLIVFGCGMLCTAVTTGMLLLNFAGSEIIIWFGVLHCLGVCMLLWSPMKRLPTWALGVLGAVLVLGGLWLRNVRVPFPWLIPLGLVSPDFASSDFFPLLPNLGFFLLGAVIGRRAYRNKRTLLPRVNTQKPVVKFFCFCGRQSLLIYLLHQPVLAGLVGLVALAM